MSIEAMLALFGTMVVLAAMPSLSVLTVIAHSAASGFAHGSATAAGIVAGDLVYILLALFGLGLIADIEPSLLVAIRVLGAVYLCYLAWRILAANAPDKASMQTATGLVSSFSAGLLLTLADHKAILFYIVLFPAFIDVSALQAGDILMLLLITVVAVGGVKLIYAWLAARSITLARPGWQLALNRLAAGALVCVAAALLITTL